MRSCAYMPQACSAAVKGFPLPLPPRFELKLQRTSLFVSGAGATAQNVPPTSCYPKASESYSGLSGDARGCCSPCRTQRDAIVALTAALGGSLGLCGEVIESSWAFCWRL